MPESAPALLVIAARSFPEVNDVGSERRLRRIETAAANTATRSRPALVANFRVLCCTSSCCTAGACRSATSSSLAIDAVHDTLSHR